MAIDAIKKLKLFSGKTAPAQKMQKLAKQIKLPGNVTQMLGVLRLVYTHNKTVDSGIYNEEFMRLISETTATEIQDVQEAVQETESSMNKTSVERDVAKKFLAVNKYSNPKTALIARAVAEWSQYHNPELAFVAGLLTKVSQEQMAASDRLAMAKVTSRVFQGSSHKEAELIEFGFDHGQLLIAAIQDQKVPQAIIEALSSSAEQAKDKELVYIVQFAEFLNKAFADKQKSPSKIWSEAQVHIHNLHLNITKDEWADKLSNLFVNTIEFEMSL